MQVILFLTSSIGVINGLFLSIYFLFILKPKQKHNYFLAGLLLTLSIRIGKSVIYYFYEAIPNLGLYIQVGLSACFLIGPMLYCYVYYFLKKEVKANLWKYHLSIMTTIIVTLGIYYPYMENRPVWFHYIVYLIYMQWFIYLLFAGKIVYDQYGLMLNKQDSWKSQKSWVLSVFWGTVFIWGAYMSAMFITYILGALAFTFMLYLLVFLLLINANDRSNMLLLGSLKYGGRRINHQTSNSIIEDLSRIMTQQELY